MLLRNTKGIILCVMLMLSLVACSAPPPSVPPADQENSQGNVAVPNPVVEYDTPDFTEAAGFKIAEYPDEPQRCALIADEIAEMDVVIDQSNPANFRVAVDNGEDISGVYDTFKENTTEDMDGVMVAMGYTEGGPMLSKWIANGYTFSLFIAQGNLSKSGFIDLTGRYVQEVVMEPETAPSL